MVIPPELREVLVSTPDTLGGSVRFKGTRVPVQALLDSILCGDSVDFFLDDFPDVSRDQALAVLTWEHNRLAGS